MAALPVGKLVYLFMRQVSKPVSKIVLVRCSESQQQLVFVRTHFPPRSQRGALKNEAFKDYVCAPVGQGWHWVSVKAKRLVTDGARREVRRLDPTEAVQEGAEILAEVFVFGIASSYVVYEYVKSNQKSAAQKAELNKCVLLLLCSSSY